MFFICRLEFFSTWFKSTISKMDLFQFLVLGILKVREPLVASVGKIAMQVDKKKAWGLLRAAPYLGGGSDSGWLLLKLN